MSAPVIDPRDQAAVLAEMTADLQGYTPEWTLGPGPAGSALMQIFARQAGILIGALNQVPQRSLLAFLDMLGTHLLPAQAAQAALVFTLAESCPVDVTLPENSLIAAPPAPVVPTMGSAASSQASAPQPLLFATLQPITLCRAKLASLYSVDPGSDEYADHTTSLTSGFTFFANMAQTEHAIYLGHDSLFALKGSFSILLQIGLRAGADASLSLQWEYLSQNGWAPLVSAPEDDTTAGLTTDGTITLQRSPGPDATQGTFAGISSYWVRGTMTSPMLPDGIGGQRTIPIINTIQARLMLNKNGLQPDAAFADAVSLDVSKDFYPFGQQPARYSTFYFASTEVFQRKSANIEIDFTLSQPGVIQGSLELQWDYFNGSTWSTLTQPSYQFTADGSVIFVCPRDWQQTSVNGAKNYWIRVRIISGGYGCPLRINVAPVTTINDIAAGTTGSTLTVGSNRGYCGGEQAVVTSGTSTATVTVQQSVDPDQLVLTTNIDQTTYTGGTIGPPNLPSIAPSSLQPPVIKSLSLKYTYYTDPELLDHCLSKNDFVFEDHTQAALWPDQTFTPFHPVSDVEPGIHFEFDQAIPAGVISLYVDIPQAVAQSGASGGSTYVWEYLSASGWSELGVRDETLGFQVSGMIQFAGQPDAIAAPGPGGNFYRVRARLKQGEQIVPAAVSGIWLNAVWATQQSSNATELVGTSDGNPGQTLVVRNTPVLAGELIEVQEWTGNGDGWQTALTDVPSTDLRFVQDAATGIVTEVWVHWYEQPNLYDSGPRDRHYVIERATGFIRFGPPGMIPPAGNAISATYQSGGGAAGNVPSGAITELHTAIPYVTSVTNPIAASGGADTETTNSVSARGPQTIRNRDRAVSPSDFEWLAREASPDVGRARCFSVTGPDGHAQRGWVTLVVVPRTLDPQPMPTAGFQTEILNYLSARAPFSAMSQIRIAGPTYFPVGVWLEVVPKQADQAAVLESQIRDQLNQFLHPLSGGPSGQGWDFGQPLYLSQVAAVIGGISGVAYVPGILMKVNGQVFDDFVPVAADGLIASGTHEIKLTFV